MLKFLKAVNPLRLFYYFWDRYQQQKLDAAAFWAMYHDVRSLHRWCAEFGIVDDTTTWLLRRSHRYRAPLGEPSSYDSRDGDIDQFREYLRRNHPAAAVRSSKG